MSAGISRALCVDSTIIQRTTVITISHSGQEKQLYCIGNVGDGILTVRFTYRDQIIRIFGAGYWRKGKKIYEEQNQIHG